MDHVQNTNGKLYCSIHSRIQQTQLLNTTPLIAHVCYITIQTQMPDAIYKAIEARAVAMGHDASKIRMIPQVESSTEKHIDATKETGGSSP